MHISVQLVPSPSEVETLYRTTKVSGRSSGQRNPATFMALGQAIISMVPRKRASRRGPRRRKKPFQKVLIPASSRLAALTAAQGAVGPEVDRDVLPLAVHVDRDLRPLPGRAQDRDGLGVAALEVGHLDGLVD